MIFRIISDEDEQNIRVRLSCGEYFFRKEYKILPVILVLVCMVILYFVLTQILFNTISSSDSEYKLFIGCAQVIVGVMMFISAVFTTVGKDHDVIVTVTKDGIEVKSEINRDFEPVFIEKLNIASIYVQVEKINYKRDYPLSINKNLDIYSIILKSKKPVYLPVGNDYKQKFLLYRDSLTEKEYLEQLEPKLNILKKKLRLSTKQNIKVIKEYNEKNIEKF